MGLFQSEKYYYNKTIQLTLRRDTISCNITSFLNDLADIRDKTLVLPNIISAFIYSGIYSPNPVYILK